MYSAWLSFLEWLSFLKWLLIDFWLFLDLWYREPKDDRLPCVFSRRHVTESQGRQILDWVFSHPYSTSLTSIAQAVGMEPNEVRLYLGSRGVTEWHVRKGRRDLFK